VIPAGAGIGLFVQVSLLGGAERGPDRDLGAATGGLSFFTSAGGAFGAILTRAPPGGTTRAPPGGTVAAYHAVFG
jgi:hypothetical protein